MTNKAPLWRSPRKRYDPNDIVVEEFKGFPHHRVIADIILVQRCTEALDWRQRVVNLADPDGRLIEIDVLVGPRQTLLLDRRLARQVALQILEIAGPAEELPTDLLWEGMPEVVYDDTTPVGFRNQAPVTTTQEVDRGQES